MGIIEKLGIKELLCIPCSQIKPSESIEFSAVPHVQLKERERIYRKMLEALINTWDGESFNIDKGLANDIIDVVEKATGKTWEEIEELKE